MNDYPAIKVGVPFWLRKGYVAITLPPFGIWIKEGMEMDRWRGVRDHELIHWEQYLRGGAIRYYWQYVKHFLKGGTYEDHPMEIEARERSGVR